MEGLFDRQDELDSVEETNVLCERCDAFAVPEKNPCVAQVDRCGDFESRNENVLKPDTKTLGGDELLLGQKSMGDKMIGSLGHDACTVGCHVIRSDP